MIAESPTLSVERLRDVLGSHRRWLESAGADGVAADLSGVNLAGMDLSGADLSYANLAGADLTNARLTGAKLVGANLLGATIAGADLSGATLLSTPPAWPDDGVTTAWVKGIAAARAAADRRPDPWDDPS